MEKRNNIEDSFVVCENCKWASISWDDLYSVCLKAEKTEQFPEGITEERYKVTYAALTEFRANNNGKCPYFEKRLSFFQRLKKMLGF